MIEKSTEWVGMARLMGKAELGMISPHEREALDKWLAESPRREKLKGKVREKLLEFTTSDSRVDPSAAFERFISAYGLRTALRRRRLLALKYAAAVVAVPALFLSAYFMFNGRNAPEIKAYTPNSNVVLTLDDGRQFELTGDGQKIMIGDGIGVVPGDDALVYELGYGCGKPMFNTITVPEFDYYEMTLSDGSRVKLNSGTKLRYAVPFEEGRREVWLEGEAYFAVESNRDRPFIVHFGQSQITALGTEFNIKAYGDRRYSEATLVEGVVECSSGDARRTLAPGDKILVAADTGGMTVQPADVEVITAWTHGRFYFRNRALEDIASELSRWYDVEISFEDNTLRSQNFTLEVSRYEDFNKIFDILVMTGRMQCRQHGHKIIIYK